MADMLGICMTPDFVMFAQEQSGKLTTASMATKQTSPPPKKKNHKAISLIIQNNSRKTTPPFTIKFNKDLQKAETDRATC